MNTIDPASASSYLAAAHANQEQAAKKAAAGGKVSKAQSFSNLVKSSQNKENKSSIGLPAEILSMSFDDAVVYLKDELDAAGNDITCNATPANIDRYKKAVGNFIKFVEHNYTMESYRSVVKKRDGSKVIKQRTLIQAINQKLDQLANDVWYNHLDKLKTVQKVDEIKGLVIDLLAT